MLALFVLFCGCASPSVFTKLELLQKENQDLRNENQNLRNQLVISEQQRKALEARPTAYTPSETQPIRPRMPSVRTPEKPILPEKKTINLSTDKVFVGGGTSAKNIKLTKNGKKALDDIIKKIKKEHPDAKITVESHLVRIKSSQENAKKLSDARAKAVADYMIKQGIKSTQISSEGLVETKGKGKTIIISY
jgi:OOP family OmpA-OmpF porin